MHLRKNRPKKKQKLFEGNFKIVIFRNIYTWIICSIVTYIENLLNFCILLFVFHNFWIIQYKFRLYYKKKEYKYTKISKSRHSRILYNVLMIHAYCSFSVKAIKKYTHYKQNVFQSRKNWKILSVFLHPFARSGLKLVNTS